MKRLSSKAFFKEIANDAKLSLGTVEDIVASQFTFTKQVIRDNNPVDGNGKVVFIREFGKFCVTPKGKAFADRKRAELEENGTFEHRTVKRLCNSEVIFIDDTE